MSTPVSDDFPKLGPPRDRRRRKRILTLRNAGWFALGLVICLTVISVISEMRGGAPGEYGRLYSRRTRHVEIEPRQPYTIVQEQAVNDATGADPMLLEAARRQQYLGVTDADMQQMIQAANPQTSTAIDPLYLPGEGAILEPNSNREKARIEITGGPGGVQIQTDTNPND